MAFSGVTQPEGTRAGWRLSNPCYKPRTRRRTERLRASWGVA